jgi:hypothetical protein
MNQKISTGIGTAIIIIIAITAGVLVSKYDQSLPVDSATQSSYRLVKPAKPAQENATDTSGDWTLVSHENFWNNPALFANQNYKFPPIKFSYPKSWEFKCCGDADFGSEHFINSSKTGDASAPYIRIINHSLRVCIDPQEKCSIDKTITLSAYDKFERLTADMHPDQVLPRLKLKSLGVTAFVYKKIEKDNKFSKEYLVIFGRDIFEIDFVNYESLPDSFIDDFLDHILADSPTTARRNSVKKWEVYKNNDLGVTFNYPASWGVAEIENNNLAMISVPPCEPPLMMGYTRKLYPWGLYNTAIKFPDAPINISIKIINLRSASNPEKVCNSRGDAVTLSTIQPKALENNVTFTNEFGIKFISDPSVLTSINTSLEGPTYMTRHDDKLFWISANFDPYAGTPEEIELHKYTALCKNARDTENGCGIIGWYETGETAQQVRDAFNDLKEVVQTFALVSRSR